MHDFTGGYDTYTEKPGYTWPADIAFADVNPADYAPLVIPGGYAGIHPQRPGRATDRPPLHDGRPARRPALPRPQTLAAAGTLHSRRTAAYPALAPDMAAAGAEFIDAAAVVDGQMVSARAWPDRPAWTCEFIRILHSKAPAWQAHVQYPGPPLGRGYWLLPGWPPGRGGR